jgi:hypothetical protein
LSKKSNERASIDNNGSNAQHLRDFDGNDFCNSQYAYAIASYFETYDSTTKDRCYIRIVTEFDQTRHTSVERRVQQLLTCQREPKNKKYRDLDQRITTVVESFGNHNVIDYLRGIAYNLSTRNSWFP